MERIKKILRVFAGDDRGYHIGRDDYYSNRTENSNSKIYTGDDNEEF